MFQFAFVEAYTHHLYIKSSIKAQVEYLIVRRNSIQLYSQG